MALFYLIECSKDRSFCIVPEHDIIFDETVEIGTEVQFFYHKKSFTGRVLQSSTDDEALKQEAKKMKKNQLLNNQNKRKATDETTDLEKRIPKQSKKIAEYRDIKKHHKSSSKANNKETSMSPNISVNEKNMVHKQTIMSTETDAEKDKVGVQCDKVNEKDIAQKQTMVSTDAEKDKAGVQIDENDELIANENLLHLEKHTGVNEFPASSTNTTEESLETVTANSEKSNVIITQPTTCSQMYGPNWSKNEMVLLEGSKNVYCIKRILDIAVSGATQPTHFIRRLVPGVFNPEKLSNVTFTGRSPHGQGADRASAQYECLNIDGKDAIIQFMKHQCIKKDWKIPEDKEIKHNFTQIIGELKRDWAKRGN